jgi:hypothetical protein
MAPADVLPAVADKHADARLFAADITFHRQETSPLPDPADRGAKVLEARQAAALACTMVSGISLGLSKTPHT